MKVINSILLFILLQPCLSCKVSVSNECKNHAFILDDSTVHCDVELPTNSFAIDTHAVTDFNGLQKVYPEYNPTGRLIIGLIDTNNQYTLRIADYNKMQPQRFGFRSFEEYKNADIVAEELKNKDVIKNDSKEKIFTIEIKASENNTVTVRQLVWRKYGGKDVTKAIIDPKLFYYESILSYERDIEFILVMPSIGSKNIDSLIECRFKEPMIKSIHFKCIQYPVDDKTSKKPLKQAL